MPQGIRIALIVAAITLASALAAGRVVAQDAPAPLSAGAIEERIASLEAPDPATGEESDKAQSIAAYQKALALAKELQTSATKTSEFLNRTEQIADELATMKSQEPGLEPGELPPSNAQSSSTGLEESMRVLETLRPKLELEREKIAAHNKEEDQRRQRLAQLPEIINGAKTELAAITIPPLPLSSAPALEQAEFQQAILSRALLTQQIESRQAELNYYKASAELFAAQGAATAQRSASLEGSVDAWQQVLDTRRLASTSAAAKRAEQDVELYADNPVAKVIAAENAELAIEHGGTDGLSQRLAAANSTLARVEAEQESVAKQFSAAKRRVEVLEGAELTLDATTGQLLRQQRQKLSDIRTLREQLRETIRQSAQAQIDLIRYEDRQADLLKGPRPEGASELDLAMLQAAREEHLNSLVRDSRTYADRLSSTVVKLRHLYADTLTFSHFIDERLLWIPSTHPINLGEPKSEAASIREMFSGGNLGSIRADIRSAFALWLGAGIALAVLLLRRKRLRAALKDAGEIAQRRNCTSFVPTAKAIVCTLLLAAPIPLLAWFVLSRAGGVSPGINSGLRHVTGFLAFSLLIKWIAHPHGLLVDHFRLSPERAGLIRTHLRWFIPLMAPYIFFAIALPIDSTSGSAGRLFFIGALLILATFLCLVLRPSKRLIRWHGKAPNLLSRTCLALAIALPAGLIIGAAAGYFASVQELRLQCMMSIGLILTVLLIAAILYRLILVSRRRLAVHNALERRAASLASAQSADESAPNPSSTQRIASQDEVKAAALNVVEVEEQTSRLVRATAITLLAFGLWGIWKPTVPALSALDNITIWEDKSTSAASAPSGSETPKGSESPTLPGIPQDITTSHASPLIGASDEPPDTRVTLQDLAASLITLLLTFVAARNIPGLLELSVLRRLRLPLGSSFAFTTTIRYFIVVSGLVVALGMIGITWGKVQWIAAAITLGIGFGLQEIFANFVAGLIILFERPIRLGDVVTVGDVSGKVTQIRIRATTIRQFNSRELIVPNKEFITGKLVNWTLSDSILRFEIFVGIAYGSDTKLATEILTKIASENQRVIKNPAPEVLFEDFAASSLLFQLRAHVGKVDDLIPAKTELRYAIDQGFREAGIEIAFPQTDIHIRTAPEKPEVGAQPSASR